MSYEDLDKARAAPAAREKAAADKGKGRRGRKRKVSAQEAEGDVEGAAMRKRRARRSLLQRIRGRGGAVSGNRSHGGHQ